MVRKKNFIINQIEDVEEQGRQLEELIRLTQSIREKDQRITMSFNDFLFAAAREPQVIFRNIFQLFYDMVHHYVPEGSDDFPMTEDSVGFVHYDMNKLLTYDTDDPFFCDRLFANRFMSLANNFRTGIQNNHIYLFEGPPGSGKSTFLNNLLDKLEKYNRLPEGAMYKIHWKIDLQRFLNNQTAPGNRNIVSFSCPNNDHPILMIPRELRKDFIRALVPTDALYNEMISAKEYEWIFKDEPCTICKSIYNTLLDVLDDPIEVYNSIHVRKIVFEREFGRGISVWNPGDEQGRDFVVNSVVQNTLNQALRTDEIQFSFSSLAYTNNGIYALMDIKDNNAKRMINLHGVISDGVHKVDLKEERIRTLFMGLINPEDRKNYEGMKSFQDRIITVNIPYVLDYTTEAKIYQDKFGNQLKNRFLPRVLHNFTRIIISTRLLVSENISDAWLKNKEYYQTFIDKNMLLLRMELYRGNVPTWLSEEDIKRFTRSVRADILALSEKEGQSGISGRMSLNLFNDFINNFCLDEEQITMNHVIDFFRQLPDKYQQLIPDGFLDSLFKIYEINLLQEVKEAIYFFNEEQISKEIQNYLFALSHELDQNLHCPYTGDDFFLNAEFMENIESRIFVGIDAAAGREELRNRQLNEFVSYTLTQEMKLDNKTLTQTRQFTDLFDRYVESLKKSALAPYTGNENFRRSIAEYGKPEFESYDEKLRGDIENMLGNLQRKFGYTSVGALIVARHVIENNLHERYKDFN